MTNQNHTVQFTFLKTVIALMIVLFITLAIVLWIQVPDLFIYFNQAFCAH